MDVESALEQAAGAIRQGNKSQAKIILAEVIRQEPRNEAAWLLLADAVERKEHAIDCLERVLKFNPNSQVAHKRLASLNEAGYTSTPKQGPPRLVTLAILGVLVLGMFGAGGLIVLNNGLSPRAPLVESVS